MAYTGRNSGLLECIYCGEARYRSSGKPSQQFVYIPLGQRLIRQYRISRRAYTLQTYCRPFFNQPIDEDHVPYDLTDWWDGRRYRELRRDGLFTQCTDVALQLLLDGVQLVERGNHSCTPVICINYNLPPAIRYQKQNILLNLVIPGPKKYKDLDSYLQPLVDELQELGNGVEAYDGYRGEDFTLKAWPVVVTGLAPVSIQTTCYLNANMCRGWSGHF